MISVDLQKHETTINRYLNEQHTNEKITSNSKGSDSFPTKEQTSLLINHLS